MLVTSRDGKEQEFQAISCIGCCACEKFILWDEGVHCIACWHLFGGDSASGGTTTCSRMAARFVETEE